MGITLGFIAPHEQLQCFTTIGQEELNKLIIASKPIFIIISRSCPEKTLKMAVIKPLIKKPQLDPNKLANYRPISNLPFMSAQLKLGLL